MNKDKDITNQKQIDDIVSMIDQFMSRNGGHINVTVNNEDMTNALNKEVVETNSLECCGDMACKVPTLHNGLDRTED